eukprot:g77882.t1
MQQDCWLYVIQVARQAQKHGVDGVLECSLIHDGHTLVLTVTSEGKSYHGNLQVRGPIEKQDLLEAFETVESQEIVIALDKLRISGAGFKVKLDEMVHKSSLTPKELAIRKIQRLSQVVLEPKPGRLGKDAKTRRAA